jgi:hypothetical protein
MEQITANIVPCIFNYLDWQHNTVSCISLDVEIITISTQAGEILHEVFYANIVYFRPKDWKFKTNILISRNGMRLDLLNLEEARRMIKNRILFSIES